MLNIAKKGNPFKKRIICAQELRGINHYTKKYNSMAPH
jgi:hypothetical protein